MAQFKPGDLFSFGVGQKRGEAVAIMIGELELGSGVGAFPAANQSGAFGPACEINRIGQLRGPGTFAVGAVGLDRRLPS